MMKQFEVQKIVDGVLAQRLGTNGFSKSDVTFEEDFDGAEIIRVIAHLEKPVDHVRLLMDSRSEIRQLLIDCGDDRYVFLQQDFPGNNFDGDDDDDDDDDDGEAATGTRSQNQFS